MLSHRKTLILCAEVAALLALPLAWLLSAYVHWRPTNSLPLERMVTGFCAVMMFSFGLACALAGEFGRVVRKPSTFWQQSQGLAPREIAALLTWSPTLYKATAAGAVIVVIFTSITFGAVEWSSAKTFTSQDGVGALLYVSAFFMLALPVLGSASRMPGAYEDHLLQLRRDAACP